MSEGEIGRVRSPILDALDLHHRLHWIVTDARVSYKPPPFGVFGDVVVERHYALNWLTRHEGAEWDDVRVST